MVRDMGYKGTVGSHIGTREVNQVQLNAHAWCGDVADRGPALLGLGLDAEALVLVAPPRRVASMGHAFVTPVTAMLASQGCGQNSGDRAQAREHPGSGSSTLPVSSFEQSNLEIQWKIVDKKKKPIYPWSMAPIYKVVVTLYLVLSTMVTV